MTTTPLVRNRALKLAIQDVWDQLERLKGDLPAEDGASRQIVEMVQTSAACGGVLLTALGVMLDQESKK